MDAPAELPVLRMQTAMPDKIAASAAVADAEVRLSVAKRKLEDAEAKFTSQHPLMVRAQEDFERAKKDLRDVQDAVTEGIVKFGSDDRASLERLLVRIQQDLAASRSAETGKEVLALEAQHHDLAASFAEQFGPTQALTKQLADVTDKEAARSRLAILDPAVAAVEIKPRITASVFAWMALGLLIGMPFAIAGTVIHIRRRRRQTQ